MARARSIKPGFFRNADLADMPPITRLLFIGLWTLADRLGRVENRPRQIKMELFPLDSVNCDEELSRLAAAGMIERYEVAGKQYLQVVNFCKHQNPHRDEKQSTITDHGHLWLTCVARWLAKIASVVASGWPAKYFFRPSRKTGSEPSA